MVFLSLEVNTLLFINSNLDEYIINLFVPNALFLYPLKTPFLHPFSTPWEQRVNECDLYYILSKLTLFRSTSPSCSNNFLAIKKFCFLETTTFEAGISDTHKLIKK